MNFVEVCIYEVKLNKTEEFGELIKDILKHHKNFPGVKDVRYIKRTHRPTSFKNARKGKPPIKLTRTPKSVTYVLYWEMDNEITHGKGTKSGLDHFYKRFARCLVTVPKMILGRRIK